MAPGASVKLGLIHQGQEKTVTLTVGTLPNEKQADATPQNQRECPTATCRSSACRWLRPARSRVATATALWSPRSRMAASPPITASRSAISFSMWAARRCRHPADVRESLADAREEGKRTVFYRGEVEPGHQVRHTCRLATPEKWGDPLASVAPAGGRTLGTGRRGPSPLDTNSASRHMSRPRRSRVR